MRIGVLLCCCVCVLVACPGREPLPGDIGEGEGDDAPVGEGEGDGAEGEGDAVPAGEGEGEPVVGEGEGEAGASIDIDVRQVDAGHVRASWSAASADRCTLTFDDLVIEDGARHEPSIHVHAAPPEGATLHAQVACTGTVPSTRTVEVSLPPVPSVFVELLDNTLSFVDRRAQLTKACWAASDATTCEVFSDSVRGGSAPVFGCVDLFAEATITCRNEVHQSETHRLRRGISASSLPRGGGEVSLAWDVSGSNFDLAGGPDTAEGEGEGGQGGVACEIAVEENTNDERQLIEPVGSTTFDVAEPVLIRFRCALDRLFFVDVGPNIRNIAVGVDAVGGQVLNLETSGYASCDVERTDAPELSLFGLAPNLTMAFDQPPTSAQLDPLLRVTCRDAEGIEDNVDLGFPFHIVPRDPAAPDERAGAHFAAATVQLPEGGGTFDVCLRHRQSQPCNLQMFGGSGVFVRSLGRIEAFDLCLSESFGSGKLTVADDVDLQMFCDNSAGFDSMHVSVGPAIERLALNDVPVSTNQTNLVRVAGAVTLSWTTSEVATCQLTKNGDVVSDGVAGAYSDDLQVSTGFQLTCTGDDGNPLSRVLNVLIGPSLEVTSVAVSSNALGVDVTTNALLVAGCRAELLRDDVVVSSAEFFPFSAFPSEQTTRVPWDFALGAVDVVARCSASDGPEVVAAGGRVTVDPLPPRIVSLTASPTALPAGGGDVELCLISEGADSCFIVTENFFGIQPVAIGPNGCVTRTVQNPTRFGVTCSNATAQRSADVIASVGPTILSFSVVAAPDHATATATWTTAEVSDCTLVRGDGLLVASGASSPGTSVPLLPGANFFSLVCESASTSFFVP